MQDNLKKPACIYPGTFDPITLGHIDIIKSATSLFSHIVVGVANNSFKQPRFDIEARMGFVRTVIKDLGYEDCVSVISFDTLLVDLARSLEIGFVIRGLRAVSDFEFEFQMGYANRSLDASLQSVFLMPSLQNSYISSTIVRNILAYGGALDKFLPPCIIDEVIAAKDA